MANSTKTNSIFTPYQVERLQSIGRFLIYVCDRDIVIAVLKLGYDKAEHAEGKRDYATAIGLDVDLDQHVSSIALAHVESGGAETKAKIRQVDRFENRWYPRARNAIRRFVVAEQREAFVEAFFRDMPQQPEGPEAVDSVRKLVPRLQEMGKSKVPGAKQAYAALIKKGLQADMDDVIGLLEELGSQPKVKAADTSASSAALEKLAQERLAAYERLNLWYTDWAEVFRGELNYHQLARLGLIEVGGSKAAAPQPTTEVTPQK